MYPVSLSLFIADGVDHKANPDKLHITCGELNSCAAAAVDYGSSVWAVLCEGCYHVEFNLLSALLEAIRL